MPKFLKFKQNDTYGTIDYTLMNDNGTAFSIPSGATVDFYASDKSFQTLLISGKSASIVNADSGSVSYQLESGDLIKSGDYYGEFRVTFSDGTIKSFPENGYLSIHIDQSINNGETEYLIQVTDLNSFKDSISSEVDAQNARIDNLISSTPQPSEVVDARVSDDGTTYNVLKDRLDTEHEAVTSQLADIAYDVRQPPYNAKCNGIDDDSIAIQNAINDAKTNGGGTIYFPKATYTIKNTITLSNTPTIWFRSGSNERNTKLSWYGASGGLMFDGINLTYFKAEGLEFDGRTIAGIGFKIRSDGTAPSFSNNFQNCYFDRFTDKAVQLGDYTQSGRDDEVEFTLFQNCYFDTNNVGLFIDTLEAVDTHLIKCGFIGSSTSISQYHIRLHRAGQVVMNGGFFTHAQIDFYLESGWVSLNDIDSETGLHENGQFLVANGYNQGDLAPGRAQKLITLKNILSHAKGDATNNRAIDVKCGPGIEFDNCQFMGNVYLGGDCRQVINNGLNLLDYSGVTGYTGFIANPSIQFQTFGSGLNTQQVAEIYEPIHTAHGTLSVGSGVTTINVDMIANSKYGFFDTNYTVMVTPQWNTTFWITNKQDSGFTINFGTAPASATKVEWTALRSYSNRPSAMM